MFAVTGATGFIGRHLVQRLKELEIPFRLLTRDTTAAKRLFGDAQAISGDLRDMDVVARFVADCDVIVHLAYPTGVSDEETDLMVANLARSAIAAGVKRFIHVSTAAVVGACTDDVIDETSVCKPVSLYQRQKLRIEKQLEERSRGHLSLVILRPTSVFSPDGQNAVKLIDDLVDDSLLTRATRIAVLGRRRLHLVAVENVVEAIRFLAQAEMATGCEVFFVSDDGSDGNNYRDVARRVSKSIGVRVPDLPAIPFHERIVSLALRVRGQSLSNPRSIFSAKKLFALGYRPVVPFDLAVDRMAAWYKSRVPEKGAIENSQR